MRSVLERMARAGHAPLYSLAPQQARAAYEGGGGVLEVPRPVLARVEVLEIATRDGGGIPGREPSTCSSTTPPIGSASTRAVITPGCAGDEGV